MDFLHNIVSFFWTLFWIVVLISYLMALFSIISDLFRDQELSGGMKAVWLFFLFFLPVLTGLAYLITRGRGMAQRNQRAAHRQQEAVDTYIRDVAGGPAGEIAKAKELLDAGTITSDEFDKLKARTLA
jgi:hypothetical protein